MVLILLLIIGIFIYLLFEDIAFIGNGHVIDQALFLCLVILKDIIVTS